MSFFRRHKIITAMLLMFLLMILLFVAFLASRMIGPHRFYRADIMKTGDTPPGVLQVGVARRDITPDLSKYDEFIDADNNNTYRPKDGFYSRFEAARGPDSHVDRNKNGRFDPVWLAGFNNDRPAKGVHDPLWARAIVFRNNGVTVAMVTLDAIGMFHEQVIDIRKSIDPALKIDHVIVSCLHNHEAPDIMGLYSGLVPTPWTFDYAYLNLVKTACKDAVEEAVRGLQPAEMQCVTHQLDPAGFVVDSRQPVVIDTRLNCARFVKPGTDDTIATLVNWSNHPEVLDGRNPFITSDFCGYWRDSVENGVPEPAGAKGLGGMCLYFQGMVGGLATPLDLEVPHRDGVRKFKEGSFEKAEALGQNLALRTVAALRSDQTWKSENPRVSVAAKTFFAPLGGSFRLAIMLGLFHPGYFFPNKARSEVDVVRIGDLEILTVPGELYPEIADGGIENPPGGDFGVAPVEVPPLRRDIMNGRMRMVFGLANDEIGYIVPKSQWDQQEPRAYKPDGQYGEDNSTGPEVAPTIHRTAKDLLNRMHDALAKAK